MIAVRTPLVLRDRGGQILLGLLVASAILVPVFNQWVPQDSAFHLSGYRVSLFGKYLCFALAALSIDLVWGYCGLLSLGHAAFFGLGGYCMAMHLMRQVGDRGQYKHPILMDSLVFLNWTELPWYWYGSDNFVFMIAMVILVPAVLATIFGWLGFRSRVVGVYFSIMSLALTFSMMLAFFRNNMGFGGNNGMTDFMDLLGYDVALDITRCGLYVASAGAVAMGYILCRYIVASKAGRVLVTVRDAENRARFLGYRVENYKVFAFTFSAILAGIAGALYVPQVQIINPSEFKVPKSIEIVIWVAIGGRGTLFGAIFGGVFVNYFKTYFTTWLAEFWLFALGALFVAVTVLLPKGIVGLVGQINDKIKLGEVKGSAHPPPRTIIQILFSYEGRIGRGTFSAVIIPFFIVGAGVFVVSMWLGGIIESTKSGVLQIIIVAVFGALTSLVVVMTSMLLAIFIKRFHDLDKAGKWGLRLFILAVVWGS